MLLTFSVSKQIITRTDSEKVVRDSQNYLYAKLTFTDEWTGTKTMVFRGKSGDAYNVILDNEDSCLVPWEVLIEPSFEVSVFCGDLITANVVTIYTIRSGYEIGEESRIPTPDIYNQIIEKINDIETGTVDPEVVAEVVDEYLADKGIVTEEDVETIVQTYFNEHKDELKGDKGDTGATGPQGPEGPQGPAGKDGADGKDGKDGQDGSVVTVTQTLSTGTKIAEIDVDGTTTNLYAPSGSGSTFAQFEVTTSGWTADTTSQSGSTLYKKAIPVTSVSSTFGVVSIGATGTLPTVAQQTAFDLIQYVTIDSAVPCLYLYASDIPTDSFYIKVEGVA